jgi:hypothetical protein
VAGRLLLACRLVRGDIQRRRVQSVLLLAMIATATTTLTLALALHGVTDSPFARTRAATKGPDVAGLGVPIGLVMYIAVDGNEAVTHLPILWPLAAIPTTLIAVAGLTAIPARIGAHRPIAEVLRSE